MTEGAHQEKPISLFYSYSHRDEALRGELEAHLSFLRRSKLISEWHDRMIGAGDEWKGQINRQLEVADIILLLVSADFIASDYCWGEEMTKALARHKLGDAWVIPVILRPCRWQSTPLGSLQAVPKDGKPVSEWPNHDAAFNEIATAIERTIDNVQEQRRRASEQAQQQTQEARKRAEAKARQAIEEQQRDAQWREQDEARRAADAEARHPAIKDFPVFRAIDAPWCPEMVALPAGEFLMGSPEGEEGRYSDESPQHRVTIDRRFAIGRYAVTFDEYDHFCASTEREKPWDAGWSRGRRPVINISWRDAVAYCAWLADKTGQPYRLPSEAEWEYACRAGTTTRYAFGDSITPRDANYSENWLGGLGKTTEVGAYPPNTWGLHDMHGNVWEWVKDVWHDSYKGAPTDGTAWIDSEGVDSSRYCVDRGGSWYDSPRVLRSAIRYGDGPDVSGIRRGFRVARTLD